LLPQFSGFIGRPLGAQAFDNLFWLSVVGLFAVGVLASCGYPALALSRFAPLDVLNGSGSPFRGLGGRGREGLLRRVLVVFQFGCSAALIFALVVVGKQLRFLEGHDKGLSLDQIVAVKTPPPDWNQDSLNRLRLTALKHEIGQISGVNSVTASSVAPSLGISTISGTSSGLVLAKKPSEVRSGTIYIVDAEPGFYETFGIRFLAGQPYRAPDLSRELDHVVINRKMMELLGLPSPEAAIGEEIAYANNPGNYHMKIEGVVDNFHIETLKEPARPTIYPCIQDVRNGFVSVKLDAAQAQPILASMERAWKQSFPESPFEYWFLDEQFALQYQSEAQLGKAFGLFAALAIFIACLGLFGMSTYAAAQRTKEIGVRKVLGASVSGIVGLLAKDFLKPVALGVLLAMPLAWYFMDKWLQDFAYRIDIHWTVFAQAGVVAIVVATFTVAIQSGKAALANPVKSLRSE
jgi:putative ABC transport system permease protein